jgi:hypothetical protein
MNDIAELWSQPWHELQRTLAAGFVPSGHSCGSTSIVGAAGTWSRATRQSGNPRSASWLVQARTRAWPNLKPGAR